MQALAANCELVIVMSGKEQGGQEMCRSVCITNIGAK